MSLWASLHCHSHYSLLDGLSRPEQIAARLKECGHVAGAITDHGSISGVPSFNKAMGKVGIKAIAGSEFYVSDRDATDKTADNKTTHLCVLAKGLQGWRHLMQASSASYTTQYFYRKPRLDLERLASFSKGEFITFSGHMGSELADACFNEPKLAYRVSSYEEARTLVRKDWREVVTSKIRRFQKLFGEENFFLEIQLIDQANLPASIVVARILRDLGKKLGVPCVATADSHYARREDAHDQRILLCSALQTTLPEVSRRLEQEEDVGLGGFFRSNSYHIPSLEEMRELHGDCPEELENAVKIAERCEAFAVGGKPMLPKFDCPNGKMPDEYLMELCQSGLKEKVEKKNRTKYQERLNHEYDVIKNAGLSSYFLIVQDFIRYATDTLKSKVGKGRGSAAGCLISYLSDITRVDPVANDLIFERFYNAGRMSKDRISLPDIDTDFAIQVREQVIDYLRHKYGHDKVAQMATFSRMQGRGALKDVLRAHGHVSFDEMNRITEFVPDESEIIDQLQEMREETGEASIIQWALENNSEDLKQWAYIRDDGEIDGPLAMEFKQAIRLEGTKRSMGKHASGLIVSVEPLADIVPMVFDRSTEQMLVGVDMKDAEEIGLVKLDILGLRTLDCIMGAENFIRTGKLRAA